MTRPLLPALLLAITASANAANPIVSDIFTADPAVVVDGKRLYLYTGRDEAKPGETSYKMNEWRVFSTCDMRNWTAHGVAATVKTFAWAKADAFAADVVKHKGKYYLYAPVKHATIPGFAIGVGCRTRRPGRSRMRAAPPW